MPADYSFTSPLTVTFTSDASEMPVTLNILNPDAVHTGDRTFKLQLQNPVGGPIAHGKDILEFTIIDNGMACSRQG